MIVLNKYLLVNCYNELETLFQKNIKIPDNDDYWINRLGYSQLKTTTVLLQSFFDTRINYTSWIGVVNNPTEFDRLKVRYPVRYEYHNADDTKIAKMDIDETSKLGSACALVRATYDPREITKISHHHRYNFLIDASIANHFYDTQKQEFFNLLLSLTKELSATNPRELLVLANPLSDNFNQARVANSTMLQVDYERYLNDLKELKDVNSVIYLLRNHLLTNYFEKFNPHRNIDIVACENEQLQKYILLKKVLEQNSILMRELIRLYTQLQTEPFGVKPVYEGISSDSKIKFMQAINACYNSATEAAYVAMINHSPSVTELRLLVEVVSRINEVYANVHNPQAVENFHKMLSGMPNDSQHYLSIKPEELIMNLLVTLFSLIIPILSFALYSTILPMTPFLVLTFFAAPVIGLILGGIALFKHETGQYNINYQRQEQLSHKNTLLPDLQKVTSSLDELGFKPSWLSKFSFLAPDRRPSMRGAEVEEEQAILNVRIAALA